MEEIGTGFNHVKLQILVQSNLYSGHLLITVTFVLSRCVLLYILIQYSGHLFNVVNDHHLLVMFILKPLYNGKFISKNKTASDKCTKNSEVLQNSVY